MTANLDHLAYELASWQKLDTYLTSHYTVGLQPTRNTNCISIHINETDSLLGDDIRNLREAFLETYEFDADDLERLHEYVRQQCRAAARQLLDETTARIVPYTEVDR